MNNLFFLFFCLVLFIFPFCHANDDALHDFELFRRTEVWGLVRAAIEQDTVKMGQILRSGQINVNFQEPKYGYSVLMVAADRQMAKEVDVLLRHGADPNVQSHYDGTSAVMLASGIGPNGEDDSAVLSLLLEHGGDPSLPQVGDRPEGMYTRETPLKIAVSCCLEKVRLLTQAGADVNYVNEYLGSALSTASRHISPEAPTIVKYLLMEAGADATIPFGLTIRTGDTIYIENALRLWVYPLDSDQHKTKMEIVEYIKSFGRDYDKAPIPKRFYEMYSKEYLDSY